ncbi:MAG: hypothetical protein LBC93_01390 [Synergistaceae bacterium]|jgi:hypothetical protein|nr:hypothetical protein [Synergistaceae bacterium]
MSFTEILQQNWPIFVIFAIVSVGAMGYGFMRLNKIRASGQEFLAKHPDAAKIYLTQRALITSEAVEVHAVGGEAPMLFVEKGKRGFYILPGKHMVEVSYSYTRPGVLYKNVTQSTGAVQKELVTEPRKSYLLGFDRNAEAFTFTETTKTND